jgi:L-fuconolactonase
VAEIIDAHQHFWDPIARRDYGWMDGLGGEPRRRLYRPILPAELEPLLREHGVSRTVLVQAAPTEEEGHYLLALAESASFVAGVVAWLDLEAQDFPLHLERFRKHRKFLGVRPMLQDIEDPAWLARPAVRRALRLLEGEGVCFDFLVKPPQLEATRATLRAFPRLRAVVDHIAKPLIARGTLEPWAAQLAEIAALDGVYCKLSGMITEADHQSWSPADLSPFIRHAVRCFGPERLMFGSDWPVCTLAGSYAQVLSALTFNLDALGVSERERAEIFGGAAARFYRI